MGSNGWKVERLEDICSLITDGKHGDCQNEENSGYFFLSAKDILNGKLNYENARQITKHDFEETNKRTQLEPSDILITNSGTIGRMAFVTNHNFTRRTTFQKSVAILKPIKEKVYPPFLYYCLAARKTDIKNTASGTTQENLLLGDIRKFSISIPESIETQRRIADILSTFDDKIELNRQTNATLEAIAQAIFKEWFVDFNYPGATGEMVDSELGPIPIGWRVGKLGEVCELIKGVSYSSDELQPSNKALVTLKSINRGGGFNSSGFKEFNGKYKSSQCLVEGDLIFAQTDITQNADVIGSPVIVENPLGYERLIASLDIVKCIPVNEMPSSRTLFFFLQRQEFKDYCLSHTNGSTVLHLRSSEVPKYPMIIPCQRILRIFDSLAATLTQNVLENNKQNRILSEFRDKLLPKLMRGEIRL